MDLENYKLPQNKKKKTTHILESRNELGDEKQEEENKMEN